VGRVWPRHSGGCLPLSSVVSAHIALLASEDFMSIRTIAFFLAAAAALACASLFIASLSTHALLAWLQSLPPREARLFQPIVTLCFVLFVGLSVYLRRKRKGPEREL
jgi:hypothetical protein